MMLIGMESHNWHNQYGWIIGDMYNSVAGCLTLLCAVWWVLSWMVTLALIQ